MTHVCFAGALGRSDAEQTSLGKNKGISEGQRRVFGRINNEPTKTQLYVDPGETYLHKR